MSYRSALVFYICPIHGETNVLSTLTHVQNQPTIELAATQWGRHGFDGDVCSQEACRGAHTRDRVQNDNCQSRTGIRCLIN